VVNFSDSAAAEAVDPSCVWC